MTDELTSSQGLQVHWLVDPCKISEAPEYEQVVRHRLLEMRVSYPDLPREDGRYLSRILDHLRVIVCNLHSACSAMPSLFIAFQRAGGAYKADPAYRGFQFSYSNVRRVTDFLHSNGYIEWKKGYPGSKDYAPQLYKMRPTSKMLALLDRFHADPATIYRKTTHLETVLMKGLKKRKKTWKAGHRPPEPRRDIIKTPDRPAVRRMRTNLAIINEVITASSIDLEMDLHELEELNQRLAADPDKYKRPIDLTNKNLYRVFVDGSLHLHGRFYGGWWEGISEEDRERIVINGMPTVELDYKSIHPYILYGLEEIQPQMDDLYILQNEDEETSRRLRPLVKRFLLIMLNASSEAGAIQALREAYRKGQKKAQRRGQPAPTPPFPITAANMRPIIAQLRRQHEPIAHHFFKGVGNTLMNHDSQMAEEVLLHFARKGIACLPVHDSFIIDIRYASECWDVMRQAYAWRFGQQIPVDVIDGLERAKKILTGPKVIETSPTLKEMAREIIRMLHE